MPLGNFCKSKKHNGYRGIHLDEVVQRICDSRLVRVNSEIPHTSKFKKTKPKNLKSDNYSTSSKSLYSTSKKASHSMSNSSFFSKNVFNSYPNPHNSKQK